MKFITVDSVQPSQPNPLFISIPEVARQLGIGQTSTWALVRDKVIPVVKIGRRTLVSTQVLRDYAATLSGKVGR